MIPTAQTQTDMSPADVLAWLQAGNARFTSGTTRSRDLLAQAAATADGQHPLAAILGCIDSRVPVESVFDLGIGDAFVARTAGNVVDDDILGSLEFATEVAGARVILVLGHSACGAVKGASAGVELGHLTGLLAKIAPAVRDASGGDPRPGGDDEQLVARAVEANVRRGVAAISDRSSVIGDLCATGDLVVVGGVYDLATGHVTMLE